MKPYPFKERRQQPRVPGITVTEPGNLDDDQPVIHVPDLGRPSPEAGNVWYAEPEPPEPMTPADLIAVGALMVVSAASAIGAIAWLWGSWQALVAGA